jgi:hypothetical protein
MRKKNGGSGRGSLQLDARMTASGVTTMHGTNEGMGSPRHAWWAALGSLAVHRAEAVT